MARVSHGMVHDFRNYYFDHPDIDEIHRKVPAINASFLNSFTTLCQDPLSENILWLGGPGGLFKFDMSTGEFRWINTPDFDNLGVISDLAIVELQIQDNNLIAGLWNGAYLFNTESEVIQPIGQDRPDMEALSRVTNIRFEDDARVNISFQNGLVIYDVKNHKVNEVRLDNDELSQRFGEAMIDSKRRKWIHSSGELVVIQDFEEKAQGYMLPQNQLATPRRLEVFSDDKLIMLTTAGRSFHLFNLLNNTWETRYFTNQNIDFNHVDWQDIVKVDDNQAYILSSDQLYSLDLSSNYLVPIDLKIDFEEPRLSTLLLDSRRDLWISTINVGLYKLNLDLGQVDNYTDVFNSDYNSALYTWITDLFEDKDGRIWIRLGRSFAVYDPESEIITNFPHSTASEKTFKYIRINKNLYKKVVNLFNL